MIIPSSFILCVWTLQWDSHCSAQENRVSVSSGIAVESVATGATHKITQLLNTYLYMWSVIERGCTGPCLPLLSQWKNQSGARSTFVNLPQQRSSKWLQRELLRSLKTRSHKSRLLLKHTMGQFSLCCSKVKKGCSVYCLCGDALFSCKNIASTFDRWYLGNCFVLSFRYLHITRLCSVAWAPKFPQEFL